MAASPALCSPDCYDRDHNLVFECIHIDLGEGLCCRPLLAVRYLAMWLFCCIALVYGWLGCSVRQSPLFWFA